MKSTIGRVSFDPNAKKLAVPNSPIATIALNAVANPMLFLRSGSSIRMAVLNLPAPSKRLASKSSGSIANLDGLRIWYATGSANKT